jgi:hypothetical protein
MLMGGFWGVREVGSKWRVENMPHDICTLAEESAWVVGVCWGNGGMGGLSDGVLGRVMGVVGYGFPLSFLYDVV